MILQNGLLSVFTADSRKLDAGVLETALVTFGGLSIGLLPALIFAMVVAVIAELQFLFYHTALRRAFRAPSDDAEIAELMGMDRRKVYASALAFRLAVMVIAGVFLAIRSNFDPFRGQGRLIFGF